MAKKTAFPLGSMMPGFDFMQQLAAGDPSSGAASLQHWVAPTVDIEELERRIKELKTVQFWLEQNLLGIKATVQALEVQKMTLQALQGMNLSMGEIAKAFTLSGASAAAAATPQSKAGRNQGSTAKDGDESTGASAMADPVQWWSALNQQFQQIATETLQEAARNATQPQAEAGKPAATPKKSKAAAKTTVKKTAKKKTTASKSTHSSASGKVGARKTGASK